MKKISEFNFFKKEIKASEKFNKLYQICKLSSDKNLQKEYHELVYKYNITDLSSIKNINDETILTDLYRK